MFYLAYGQSDEQDKSLPPQSEYCLSLVVLDKSQFCYNLPWFAPMSLACYLAAPYDRQLEDLAARTLARALRLTLPPHEPASIVFNLYLYRLQLDAVLFTSHAVSVIDFKDTLGPITGNENDPWMRPDGAVKAGSFVNPYKQLFAARRTLSSYFEDKAVEIFDDGGSRFTQLDYRQVSAALLFTPVKPEMKLDLPRTSRSWLVITGLDVAASDLAGLHSRLTLRHGEIKRLIEEHWDYKHWSELETVLPDRAVGALWHIDPDGTRRSWPITRAMMIGRGSQCDLQFPNDIDAVSRTHAQLLVAGDSVALYDLESKNGTYLDGARLTPGQPSVLQFGQLITLGGPPSAPTAVRLYYTSGDAMDGPNIDSTRTQVTS